MSDHEARAELIGQVETGQMSVADAEAEALRLNLGPLASVPAAETFDPAREVHWSLPMAVAWIAYRDIQRVREHWNDYRLECWDWHGRRWQRGFDGPIYEGFVLEQRSRATLPRLGLYDAFHEATDDTAFSMTIREAREALWMALQTDCFRATGLNQRTKERQEIPPLEWYELEGYEAHGEFDELRNNPVVPTLAYGDVWIPSGSVIRLWSVPVAAAPLSLPPLVAPLGNGYMPLFCAAQWIATGGGAVDFDSTDQDIWRGAYRLLLDAIASEKVRVTGIKGGQRDPVPAYIFADCVVDYPFAEVSLELVFSSEIYLRSYGYLDEEHWRNGFDDALIDRHRDHWTRLMVSKDDVRREWSYGSAKGPARTGAPGRPSSMQLIIDEFDRRVAAREMTKGVAAQAVELHDWLETAYPHEIRPTCKTIENRIREAYRQATKP